jgi:hypothetical protein
MPSTDLRDQRGRPTTALKTGISLVARAPVVFVCVFVMTFLAALTFSALMRQSRSSHQGNSMAAEQAARGVNVQRWTEFARQAGPLGQTFQTTIIGSAAPLDNLSTLADGGTRSAPILWAGAFYLVLWLFLSGGIVDRYARGRPTRSHEFFMACGVYFARFLRLAPLVAAAYYVLFALVHPVMFGVIYEALVRDVTSERTAFLIRLALYLVFAALVMSVNVVFDYAKVRAIVEDRRSMIGAVAAAGRFVRRNAASAAALYLLNTCLFVAVLIAYALTAPGPARAGAASWLAIAIGQIYLAARLWVKLVFLASETSLFQGRLAHAGYLARSAAVRPEPPAVEQALRTADSRTK